MPSGLADLAAASRPQVQVALLPREPIETQLGEVLPIGLDDFRFLHVQVTQSAAGVRLAPRVTVQAMTATGPVALPLFAPTLALFVAFTGETLAGKTTGYQLSSPALPLWLNLVTVGMLQLITTTRVPYEREPTAEDYRRSAPLAYHLTEVVSPPHGCREGSSPCERYLVMPAPKDDVALQLTVDIELEGPAGPKALATQRFELPAGKPLGERLAAVFPPGQPVPVGPGARWSLGPSRPARGGCALRERDCGAAPTEPSPSSPPPPSPAFPAAPSRLATPEESLAARPRWNTGPGYAPKAVLDAVDPAARLPGGELRDAVLACDLDYQGPSGDVFPASPPDISIEVRRGRGPVYWTYLPDDTRGGKFFIPLVSLSPGDKLDLTLWDRDTFSNDYLTARRLTYRGVLPLVDQQGRVAISCQAVGRPAIETLVTQRLAALASKLENLKLGAAPISERSKDWGFGSWGIRDIRQYVEEVAALVGWTDPRLAPITPVLDHYQSAFNRHLGYYLKLRQRRLPEPGQVLPMKKGEVRVIGSRCGAELDRKHVLWWKEKVPKDGCVTVVEITNRAPEVLETSPRTGSLGAIWSLELAWLDGRRTDAWSVGVELPVVKRRRDPEHPVLHTGESARFYLAPQEPYHRAGQEGPLFLLGLDWQTFTFVRLR